MVAEGIADSLGSKTIFLVGDSPAIYVCAIYLYTANIKPIVLRRNFSWDYTCNVFPGLNLSKTEIDSNCYEQARHMGIKIIESAKFNVFKEQNKYVIELDDTTINADILVADSELNNIKPSESLFIVKERLNNSLQESIIIAGEGCKIAFEIKDLIN